MRCMLALFWRQQHDGRLVVIGMSIPLAQMTRTRRKRVMLRPFEPTRVLVNDLYAIYADSVHIWSDLAQKIATEYEPAAPIATDADGRQLAWLVDQAARQADNTILYQTDKLGRWVSRVGEWNRIKTISSVKSALGVDIAPYMRLSDVRPMLDDTIRENVALIRDVNARTRASVEQILYDALVNRRTKKEVRDALAKAMGITKRRAQLIAADQTHKMNIALTAYRNQELGIKSYVWVTRRDDRVRPAHRARNGHVFEWSKPPYDGHPGFAINCRCEASPVVELG